jgi:hypothetical protein
MTNSPDSLSAGHFQRLGLPVPQYLQNATRSSSSSSTRLLDRTKTETLTRNSLRKAFRLQAREVHPDKYGPSEKEEAEKNFKLLAEAAACVEAELDRREEFSKANVKYDARKYANASGGRRSQSGPSGSSSGGSHSYSEDDEDYERSSYERTSGPRGGPRRSAAGFGGAYPERERGAERGEPQFRGTTSYNTHDAQSQQSQQSQNPNSQQSQNPNTQQSYSESRSSTSYSRTATGAAKAASFEKRYASFEEKYSQKEKERRMAADQKERDIKRWMDFANSNFGGDWIGPENGGKVHVRN